MGRPRLPSDVQEMKGAWDKDPQRRRIDVQTEMPLDINDHPKHFSDSQVEAWCDIINNSPVRVLRNSDKFLVEMAARLLEKMRTTPNMTLAQITAANANLRSMLSLMGMTPADRSRVESGFGSASGDDDGDDEFSRY